MSERINERMNNKAVGDSMNNKVSFRFSISNYLLLNPMKIRKSALATQYLVS